MASTLKILPFEVLLDRRLAFGRSLAMGDWDDNTTELAMQHFATIGKRKRGRVFEDKLLKGLVLATL